MKTYLVITALLIGAFGVASCGDSDTPADGRSASAGERWKGMTAQERETVCEEARSLPGSADPGSGQVPATVPDYKGMLNALMAAGFEQPDAAAMLPYAANECL